MSSRPSSLETIASTVVIALATAWETHTGTLLGVGVPRIGPIVEGALWASCFVALVRLYGAATHDRRQAARRVALALLLALVVIALVRRTLTPLLAPAEWSAYHYLRLFVPLVLALVGCAALLPRQTRTLARAAAADARIAPVVSLAVLLLGAAALTTASDFAFQLVRGGSAMQNRLGVDVITPSAWITTTLVLFAVLAMVFGASASAAMALLLVAPIFAAMAFATLVKIHYMHSAVQPLDLLTLPEFLALFGSFFGRWSVLGTAIGLVAWAAALIVAYVRWRTPMRARHRSAIVVAAFVPLGIFLLAFLPARRLSRPLRAGSEEMWDAVSALGVPQGEHRDMARSGGIVLNFLAELPSAFVDVPDDYTPARADTLARRYAPHSAAPARGGPSVVVYLVESLMDPAELGVRLTADPIPNLRALGAEGTHGWAIVPRSFGGSANSEFELLTGMSTSFLPEGSVPYRQYVRRPVTSLPSLLRDRGYATVAVQADPRYYYDRERVYPLLGFERALWLQGMPGVARAERGNWPSDEAIVDAVLRASAERRPSFVFAFPSSTHSPYDAGTFARSDLDVLGTATPAAHAELKEYVNAVRLADRAIGRLADSLRARRDSTILVVVGDHLPPLSADAYAAFSRPIGALPASERTRETRRVPLVLWANFPLPREQTTLALNLVPSLLLERLGIAPSGPLAAADSLRRAGGAAPSAVLDDYRMIQYDALFGR